MRGFKVAKGFENSSIILPKRQTKNSAGYDFYVASDTIIKAHSVALIPTGVKAYMESDEVLKIYVRSSMPLKRKITLANNVGIIDSDYYENPDNDGHIMIQVLNFGDSDVLIKKDERIAQGVFLKYLLADDDNTSESRLGGFGSTK
ncbi:MAG: dUTP diphosphatase [bacterium]|nr:dUTP diphosphatase [bacterium]